MYLFIFRKLQFQRMNNLPKVIEVASDKQISTRGGADGQLSPSSVWSRVALSSHCSPSEYRCICSSLCLLTPGLVQAHPTAQCPSLQIPGYTSTAPTQPWHKLPGQCVFLENPVLGPGAATANPGGGVKVTYVWPAQTTSVSVPSC